LREKGIRAIFTPGASISDIINFIETNK